MEIRCEQCGAFFDDNEPKCPYCDAFHYKGSEAEYMEKLEDILEDLEDLEDVPEETYVEEAKSHVRHTGRVFAIVAAAVILMAALTGGICLIQDKKKKEQRKAQILFEREYFSQLDEWYEQEDYEAIFEFEEKLQESGDRYDIDSWSHYGFYGQYLNYKQAMSVIGYISDGGDWNDQDVDFLLNCFAHLSRSNTSYVDYSQRDRQRIDAYQAEVSEQIQSLFGLSEEDVEEFLAHIYTETQGINYDYGESYAAELTEKIGGYVR